MRETNVKVAAGSTHIKNKNVSVKKLRMTTAIRLPSLNVVSVIDRPSYTLLSTVGDRVFPIAAGRVCNDLPRHVTSRHVCTIPASSTSVVRRLIFSTATFCSACEVTCVVFRQFTH